MHAWRPPAPGWRTLGRARTQVAVCVVMAAASLWLRTGFPVTALGFAADDDALFVRIAHSLAAGEWLGPYDDLTLVKGMFYPLFMCVASLAAIPLKVAEHGVYLAVCAVLCWIAARASQRRWLGSLLFAVLALNPSLWAPGLARVIREGLYISLSPAVIALGVVVAFPPAERRPLRSALLGGLLGMVGAGFWLTREEGLWLLPAFGSILAIALADAAWPPWAGSPAASGPSPFGARVSQVAVALVVAALAFGACLQTVMRLNGSLYGVAVLNEIKARPFQRAYGALARIRPQVWRPYIVFPADVRRKAYAASPAARELAPVFEGRLDQRWRGYGCSQMGIAAKDCPEILSGWFFWALRDAVAAAGHDRSAADAQAYYTRLADEIDAACGRGALDCLPRRSGLAPPFRWRSVPAAIHSAAIVTRILLTMHQGAIGSGSSVGTLASLSAFADAVGALAPTLPPWWHLRGWVAAIGATPSLRLQAGPGQTVSSSMTLSGADDVQAVSPSLRAIRFDLDVECPSDDCALVTDASDGDHASVRLHDLRRGMAVDRGGLRLFVDAISLREDGGMADRRQALQRRVARAIARCYAVAMPVLAALGVGGIATAAARSRSRPPPPALFALAVAGLVAVVCRIALLAYLDATSIPATSLLYASPATPFVIVVAVSGLYLGAAAFLPRRG